MLARMLLTRHQTCSFDFSVWVQETLIHNSDDGLRAFVSFGTVARRAAVQKQAPSTFSHFRKRHFTVYTKTEMQPDGDHGSDRSGTARCVRIMPCNTR